MSPARFDQITSRYPGLRVGLLGDFCLDRYLEIDAEDAETSIETGLVVHNVRRVRNQPGGAGTILNNLIALGAGTVRAIGFSGDDGEGFELRRALKTIPGVDMEGFLTAADRRTFTYTKPLLCRNNAPPEELNRLDFKNWTPTPAAVEARMCRAVERVPSECDVLIILDQVDRQDTGVVTGRVLETVGRIAAANPEFLIIADSRGNPGRFPSVMMKMNRMELAVLSGNPPGGDQTMDVVRRQAVDLARRNRRPVVVTLSEDGILGADPDGSVCHDPIRPIRGTIDIVGAGDSVTANLAMSLGSGATMAEALKLANTAASIVIHQLGTTGTASLDALRRSVLNLGRRSPADQS